MSRMSKRLDALRERGEKGFIAYITAGDPDLTTTRHLITAFEEVGVDGMELGVPFSDPMADGPVNQRAAQRALKGGTSLRDILEMVGDLRKESAMPIDLFTYFNPVFQYGTERFVEDAERFGVDGALVLDVPPEEYGEAFKQSMDQAGLDTVFLLAPTSTDARIRLVCQWATGFIYYVSRTGVTGERNTLAASLPAMVDRIRSHTDKPIGVGFGISDPSQVHEVAASADAVIVGSAIVRRIEERAGDPQLVGEVSRFVGTLTAPLKGNV
ncbi:MAG: tryptophan synthase subunit alpha [Candidatus Latescibacterota bacterium]